MKNLKAFCCLCICFFSISLLSNVVDLTKYLPKGYNTEGRVDYTEFIQKGLDENLKVTMPDFPILVNKSGLKLRSNQIISFKSKSKLIMVPNEETNYAVLHVVNIENVEIFNPNIEGDRFTHLGKKGEWGMGISILSSKNILISNANIKECWGDGIYLGEDRKSKLPNENIKIVGGVIDNNRRNGISVITAKNLEISDMLISNTNGKDPMSGIDIEPNNNRQFLQNIVLKNINTINNGNEGIKVYLKYYAGSKNEISINIENLNDSNSQHGFTYSGVLKEDFVKSREMKGYIKLKNYKSDNSNKIKKHRRIDLPVVFQVD